MKMGVALAVDHHGVAISKNVYVDGKHIVTNRLSPKNKISQAQDGMSFLHISNRLTIVIIAIVKMERLPTF